MKFTDLGLNPKVLQAVEQAGYETPTPIQAEAIPHALQGRDVLGIAQTGTGKTASFTLPMLTLLAKGRARARMPRSLILAPTRELAAQVSENFETYGKELSLTKALLIGGVSFAEQDRIIDRGVDVLIATPGRLLDHFERGKLMLTGIEIMVVDEADRMLDMGFIEDIERIFKLTPFTRQTLFFSATMPPEITRLTEEFLSNPVRVEVARASSTAETVEQRLCPVAGARRDRVEAEKRRALRALIDAEGEQLVNAIIFCNRKRDVATLFKSLTSHGYNAGALHGDLDQRIRMQVLDGFRGGHLKLLVASDVAARGLDIPTVSHVFNFDVPIHAEDYVHRIGRTGRAGRAGVAITLSTAAEDKALAKVEELIKKTIPRVEAPGMEAAETSEEQDAAPAPKRGAGEGRRRASEEARPRRGGRDGAEKPDRAARGRRDESRRDEGRRDEGWRDEDRSDGRRRRGGRRRDERDQPVVGMGDHVPAFILREVPLPSRRRARDDEDEAQLETPLADDAGMRGADDRAEIDVMKSAGSDAAPAAEDRAIDPEGGVALVETADAEASETGTTTRRRRSGRRRTGARAGETAGEPGGAEADPDGTETEGDASGAEETPREAKAKPRRRRRTAAAASEEAVGAEESASEARGEDAEDTKALETSAF